MGKHVAAYQVLTSPGFRLPADGRLDERFRKWNPPPGFDGASLTFRPPDDMAQGAPTERAILSFLADPSFNARELPLTVWVSGVVVLEATLGGDYLQSFDVVLEQSALRHAGGRPPAHPVIFGVREGRGSGSVRISSVIVWFTRDI